MISTILLLHAAKAVVAILNLLHESQVLLFLVRVSDFVRRLSTYSVSSYLGLNNPHSNVSIEFA